MGEATRMERSYTKENLKRAKQMLKEYKHAKVRTIAYPRKRPTLLKQMKVDLTDYEKCGIADYDWDNCMKLNIDDCFFIDQYVSDMETVWMVEKCISYIPDGKRKQIAEDAFIHGMSNADLEKKYGLKERSIQWQKDQVARRIAEILV